MPLNVVKLIQDMDRLSKATWERVLIGDVSGLKFREDSLTDENLFSLMRNHPQLSVRRFNQNAEKESGADWEWYVGMDSIGWFRLRIQAKRIHGASYRELDHPGRLVGEYQYQTLISGCESETATYPFHVFYNGWSCDRFHATKFTSDHTDSCGPLDQELWGCAALSSHAVQRIHLGSMQTGEWSKRLHASRYIPELMPWSRLFTLFCANAFSLQAESWVSGKSSSEIFQHMHHAVILSDLIGRGQIPDGDGPRSRNRAIYDAVASQSRDTELIAELPRYAALTRLAHSYFRNAGSDYVEDNPNFEMQPWDAPPDGYPRMVAVLDLSDELDPQSAEIY
ncbi:DUF6615 family protein [Nocardia rhamnosiphila]|uniref:DUF6615 family protein n=1 Tax=Nocardia rhamnosiphila TaxID=426716 RepID=UPI0033FE998F